LCYDIRHALSERANLLKSADAGAVWTISESASAHSQARPSIINPDLILHFKTSMIWRVFMFWRSAKVWPFGVIVSEVFTASIVPSQG
jgi:hypothetical protein